MNTDVSIIDTAMQGWRDAASAREKMPNLFWIAIGILVGLEIPLAELYDGITFRDWPIQIDPLAPPFHRLTIANGAAPCFNAVGRFRPGLPAARGEIIQRGLFGRHSQTRT